MKTAFSKGDLVWIEDAYAGSPHAAIVTNVTDRALFAETAAPIPGDSRTVEWKIQKNSIGSMVRRRFPGHEREAATPMDDGTILCDCSCGAEYSVPQGGDEFGAMEAAHARHVADAT